MTSVYILEKKTEYASEDQPAEWWNFRKCFLDETKETLMIMRIS